MNSVTKAKAQAEAARQKVEDIALAWQETGNRLFDDLQTEFSRNLQEWQAYIDRETLAVRFREPSVFFGAGSSILTPGFKLVLDDFFPRYINILDRYRDHIAEVRIEGHTSSEWKDAPDKLEAYFNNMKLSQERARTVLQYSLNLLEVSEYLDWAMRTITANGMSSGRLILNPDGKENPELSRRVEFRVRIDSDSSIEEILGGKDEAGH
ncbi:MAG: OmpA family protein [Synergistaceae bacterium]|nr:OmpA family protein [Synergistaceae bacterium]